jgi:hypothetical protein
MMGWSGEGGEGGAGTAAVRCKSVQASNKRRGAEPDRRIYLSYTEAAF